MQTGIAVVESVDVGQDHQLLCAAEDGDDGGEHIVVTEQPVLRFNLCVADGIVFVYDGDDAHFQQRVEGIGQIFLLFFLLDILCVQKDLSHSLVIIPEKFIIQVHQTALPDSSCGLFHSHAVRSGMHVQFIASHGDGA